MIQRSTFKLTMDMSITSISASFSSRIFSPISTVLECSINPCWMETLLGYFNGRSGMTRGRGFKGSLFHLQFCFYVYLLFKLCNSNGGSLSPLISQKRSVKNICSHENISSGFSCKLSQKKKRYL